MPTKTSIANEALLRVGEPRISSIEDNTDLNASFLSLIWETTVKQVMSEVPWKCLTSRLALTESGTTPAFTWAHSFPVPVNFLRPLWLNGHSYPDNSYFDVENGKVVTDASTAQLVYTAYSDDVTTYSAPLIEAFTVYLASKIAIVRRQDIALADALTQEYKQLISSRAANPAFVETKSMWLEVGSDSEIMNSALARIAEPKAVEFSDPSFLPLSAVNELYTACLKQVSRSFDWKCLCKRDTLTAGTTPEFGWEYSYALPDDCLRVVEFNGRPVLDCDSFYRQEGSSILTNSGTAELLYVAYQTEETLFDEQFKDAVSALLASRLVVQRRRDANLAARLMQDYNSIVSNARLTDSSQQHLARVSPIKNSYSIKARRVSVNG